MHVLQKSSQKSGGWEHWELGDLTCDTWKDSLSRLVYCVPGKVSVLYSGLPR